MSDAYRLGQLIGALLVVGVFVGGGVTLLLLDRRQIRRARAQIEWSSREVARQADAAGGIHPAAYAPGGWLHNGEPTAPPEPPAPPGPAASPYAPPGAGPASAVPGHNAVLVALGCLGIAVGVLLTVVGLVHALSPSRTVSLPSATADLTRIQDPSTAGRIKQQADQINALGGVSHAQIGLYGPSGAAKPSLVFVVASYRNAGPADVDGFFAGISKGRSGLGPASDVDPGDLGGRAQCWASTGDNSVVCAWADDSTIGIVYMTGSSTDRAADLMRQLRAGSEH